MDFMRTHASRQRVEETESSAAVCVLAHFDLLHPGPGGPASHTPISVGSDDLWLGDRPMVEAGPSGRAAVIQAQVMAGPWTNAMKADLFARLESAVRDVVEMPKRGAGSDFWMTFVEVPEGGWGLGGRSVSIGDLAPVFSEDRQQRIRAYLAGQAAP
jgi:hypothetical protein